jgi:hypothetical protein
MSDHRAEADMCVLIFHLSARPASRPSRTAGLSYVLLDDLVICAETVPDPVGISGGVENIKIDKSLISLVGLLGLEPGTRPL